MGHPALNNPTSNTDDGHDCVYLNNAGNGVESVDQQSNEGECGDNGGYWVDGSATDIHINTGMDTIDLTGTTNGTDTTKAYYRGSGTPSDKDIMADMIPGGRMMLGLDNWAKRAMPIVDAYTFVLLMKADGGGEATSENAAKEGAEDSAASQIPGHPFTGPNAARDAFKHLQKYHGIDPIVASERLHQIKEANGLGPADNAIIGRTGDVYNPYTGEKIGSLTQPQ